MVAGSDERRASEGMKESPGRTTERSARSKAQWDKTKPKSRRQCHACGEREGQSQNYSYLHSNHPSSAMFGAFRGWRDLVGSIDQEWPGRQTDDRNRREVSDEKRCHRYLQHYTSASLEGCCKNRRKAVPYVTTDDTHCLFPAVRKAASIQVGSRDIREFPDPSQSLAFLPKL